MKFFKAAGLLLGILVVLSGVLFAAQGAGLFPYPRASFMISQTIWVYRGLGLAVLGAVMIVIARR